MAGVGGAGKDNLSQYLNQTQGICDSAMMTVGGTNMLLSYLVIIVNTCCLDKPASRGVVDESRTCCA